MKNTKIRCHPPVHNPSVADTSRVWVPQRKSHKTLQLWDFAKSRKALRHKGFKRK
jgi:hypothetical protein